MTPAGTRLRKYYEPALATGSLNSAYQLLIQDCHYREIQAIHEFQCKENQTDRMHEILVNMEARDEV